MGFYYFLYRHTNRNRVIYVKIIENKSILNIDAYLYQILLWFIIILEIVLPCAFNHVFHLCFVWICVG